MSEEKADIVRSEREKERERAGNQNWPREVGERKIKGGRWLGKRVWGLRTGKGRKGRGIGPREKQDMKERGRRRETGQTAKYGTSRL